MSVLFLELDQRNEGRSLAQVENMGVERVRRYPVLSGLMGSSIWLMDAPPGFPIATLAQVQGFIYAEPDEEHIYSSSLWRDVYPFGTSSMVLPTIQGTPGPTGSALPEMLDLIGVSQLHKNGIKGAGVLILIVDSGVNGDRLPESVKAGGWSDSIDQDPWVDEMGHGTMVAMIAHAVAPEAGIVSVKLRTGPNGGLMKLSVLDALEDNLPFLAGQRVVMNNSWGTPGCIGEPYWCGMIPSRIVWKLSNLDLATVVFAAGNSNKDCSVETGIDGFPSIICINSTPGTLSAAALDREGQPLYYSSRGPGQCHILHPFIGAPTFGVLPYGQGWIDTQAQGGGTSSAAPQVSGVVALLKSVYPDIDNLTLMTALGASARRTVPTEVDNADFDFATGFGMIQGMDALQQVPGAPSHPYYSIIREAVANEPLAGTLPTLVHHS